MTFMVRVDFRNGQRAKFDWPTEMEARHHFARLRRAGSEIVMLKIYERLPDNCYKQIAYWHKN